MNTTGNGNNGQPVQNNSVNSGNLYATGKGNINIGGQQGSLLSGKVLLGVLLFDAVFFVYGMSSYSGRNTTADQWRAGVFLFLFVTTLTLIRRWIRRRF